MLESSHYAKNNSTKPTIALLATGGTIAGVGNTSSALDYSAGVLSANDLLELAPEIADIANIKAFQIANIDSKDMTDTILLDLARKTSEVLADSSIDGVVISHGTDSVESSAYFLHLVIKSTKPIVITGAMRPSTAICYDGSKNLYSAICLASHTDAHNMGAMIVMNDKIFSARFAAKAHSLNLDAFSSNAGIMGYMLDSTPLLFYHINKLHTQKSQFDIKDITSLPQVGILYAHTNDNSAIAARALYEAGIRGIVIATMGAGSIHKSLEDALKMLIKQGLVVVKSTQLANGLVPIKSIDSSFISALDLNPQKAKILLQLALTRTQNPKHIAHIFQTH